MIQLWKKNDLWFICEMIHLWNHLMSINDHYDHNDHKWFHNDYDHNYLWFKDWSSPNIRSPFLSVIRFFFILPCIINFSFLFVRSKINRVCKSKCLIQKFFDFILLLFISFIFIILSSLCLHVLWKATLPLPF